MKNELDNRFGSLSDNYLGLKPRDGGAFYLTAYVFMVVVQLILMAVITFLPDQGGESDKLQTANYIFAALNPIIFAVTPLLYCRMMHKSYTGALRPRRTLNSKQILLAVAVSVLTLLTFAPIASGFIELIKLTGYNPDKNAFPMPPGVGNYFLQIALFAVLPAIGEEILFRGFVAQSFKAKSYGFAVLLSALFFALFHGSATQLVHQFFLGIILAVLFFSSGSIYAPIIVHFLNNFMAVSLQHIEYLAGTALTANMPVWTIALIYAAIVLVAGVLLYIAVRAFMRESKARAVGHKQKISAVNWLRDLGRAFYPGGIKLNWKNFNDSLKAGFQDPHDSEIEDDAADAHSDVTDEKLREQLIALDKDAKRKSKIRDRNIVILAGVLIGVVWILNFVINLTDKT